MLTHVPQPVRVIINTDRGNPITPDTSLSIPFPGNHGNLPLMSNPTEHDKMPPKPTNAPFHSHKDIIFVLHFLPANRDLQKRDDALYLDSVSPNSSN